MGYIIKEEILQSGAVKRRGPFVTEQEARMVLAVAMTAETDRMEAEARRMLKEVSRRRSEAAKLRKVVRNGELIKHQENKARLKFVEKVKRLATMPVE